LCENLSTDGDGVGWGSKVIPMLLSTVDWAGSLSVSERCT